MRRRRNFLQRFVGWVIVFAAVAHFVNIYFDYDSPSLEALWYTGTGFTLLLVGCLNIVCGGLRSSALAEVVRLRSLTLLSNVCGLILGIMYVSISPMAPLNGIEFIVLFGIATGVQANRFRKRRVRRKFGYRDDPDLDWEEEEPFVGGRDKQVGSGQYDE